MAIFIRVGVNLSLKKLCVKKIGYCALDLHDAQHPLTLSQSIHMYNSMRYMYMHMSGIAGKFSRGPTFAVFADDHLIVIIKPAK